MMYLTPVLSVILSYVCLCMVVVFEELNMFVICLAVLLAAMGVINLVVVLTAGRKCSRKTLLNCTLILKYGMIPFYIVDGLLVAGASLIAVFPLPLMILFGFIAVALAVFGYIVMLGSAPYAIAYIVRGCKDGVIPTALGVVCGIFQFFFVSDVVSMMVLTIRERHLVKTTIAICCVLALTIAAITAFVVMNL